MQKVGHAVSKIDIRHVKSPAHNAQHGVRTLRLHSNNIRHVSRPFRRGANQSVSSAVQWKHRTQNAYLHFL